jgi:hypothetical protein
MNPPTIESSPSTRSARSYGATRTTRRRKLTWILPRRIKCGKNLHSVRQSAAPALKGFLQRRLVAGGLPAAGSNRCSSCDREERQDKRLDRRRHGISQEGRSFGWRRPAILRSAWQAGQLSGRCLAVGSQRARKPAARLSALSSRGLGGRLSSPGQSRRARGRRVQDQTANRP